MDTGDLNAYYPDGLYHAPCHAGCRGAKRRHLLADRPLVSGDSTMYPDPGAGHRVSPEALSGSLRAVLSVITIEQPEKEPGAGNHVLLPPAMKCYCQQRPARREGDTASP